MKIPSLVITTVILTISGCASTQTENVEFERIASKEQYLELVAGRVAQMKGSNFSSTAFADGTMKGGGGDRKLSGTWTWEDGFFCREGTIGSDVLKRDCQIIEISGDTLKVKRNRGEGENVVLQLK